MKKLLIIPIFFLFSCGNEKEAKQDALNEALRGAIKTLDSASKAQEKEFAKIDTVGCVVLDTKTDTSITKGKQKIHIIAESHCVGRHFLDTTKTVDGMGHEYTDVALYSYREARIMFDVNDEIAEVFLTNDTFKDSVSAEFYRRGMLSYPENIQFIPKDTTLKFVIDLFVPGDTRMIISAKIDLKGKVKILSTKYEGAF